MATLVNPQRLAINLGAKKSRPNAAFLLLKFSFYLSAHDYIGEFFFYMPTMRMYFLILQKTSIIIRAIRTVKFVVAVHKFKK